MAETLWMAFILLEKIVKRKNDSIGKLRFNAYNFISYILPRSGWR